MCICKQTLTNGDMAVCRLCSGTEEILNVFNSNLSHPHQLRLSIFLATGVQIKETDTVSKMVCHRCCEIVLKLHLYRSQAVSNDRLLKEQNGQQYEPPIINPEEIVRQASIIVSEQMLAINQSRNSPENSDKTYHSVGTNTEDVEITPSPSIDAVPENESCTDQDSQDKSVSKVPVYKHPSVYELCKQNESIILPVEVINSNISPIIPINSLEVTEWYAEQANKIQKRLKNLVIKKVSSGNASVNPSIADHKANILDLKPNIEDPKPNIISVSYESSSNYEPSSSSCHSTSSDYSDITTSDDDSVDMNKTQSSCNYQKENDASKINIMPNTPVVHAHIPNKETAREVLQQKPQQSDLVTKRASLKDNSKNRRKQLLSLRKRSVDGLNYNDDDEDEVIPKKKNRSLANPDWRRKNRIIPYYTRQSEILPTPQTVTIQAAQVYESTSIGLSPTMPITTIPSEQPWYQPATSTLQSSIPLNTITPPPTPESAPPLDQVDMQNILTTEKTQSVFVCPVCNKVCYSKKFLSEHEKKHLRCKFCKTRVKNVKLLIEHLSENCVINIVKNPPNLKLTKVDNVQAVVKRYPEAFEELCESNRSLDNLSSTVESTAEYSASNDQFVECTKIVSFGQKPTIINENTDNIYISNLGEVSTEVEVVCLTDASDDEIEFSDIPRHPIVNNPYFNLCATVDEGDRSSVINSTSRKHSEKENITLRYLLQSNCIDDISSPLSFRTTEASTTPFFRTNETSGMSSTIAVAPPKINISPKPLNYSNEREMINILFKKYQCSPLTTEKSSQTHTAQQNQVRCTDTNLIVLDTLVPELEKYKIPVYFYNNCNVSARFQEQSVQKQRKELRSWGNIKPIHLRQPHLSYPIKSISSSNTNVMYNSNRSPSTTFNTSNASPPIQNKQVIDKPTSTSNNVSRNTTKSVAPVANTGNDQPGLVMLSASPATAYRDSAITQNSVSNSTVSTFPQNNHSSPSNAVPHKPLRHMPNILSNTLISSRQPSINRQMSQMPPSSSNNTINTTKNVYNCNAYLGLSKSSSIATVNNGNPNMLPNSGSYMPLQSNYSHYPQAVNMSNISPYQTLINPQNNLMPSVQTTPRYEKVIQINNNITNVSKYVMLAPPNGAQPTTELLPSLPPPPPPPYPQSMQMHYSSQQYALTNNKTTNSNIPPAQIPNDMVSLKEYWELIKFNQ